MDIPKPLEKIEYFEIYVVLLYWRASICDFSMIVPGKLKEDLQ